MGIHANQQVWIDCFVLVPTSVPNVSHWYSSPSEQSIVVLHSTVVDDFSVSEIVSWTELIVVVLNAVVAVVVDSPNANGILTTSVNPALKVLDVVWLVLVVDVLVQLVVTDMDSEILVPLGFH